MNTHTHKQQNGFRRKPVSRRNEYACMRNDDDDVDGIQEKRQQTTNRIDDKIIRYKIMKKHTERKQGHQ